MSQVSSQNLPWHEISSERGAELSFLVYLVDGEGACVVCGGEELSDDVSVLDEDLVLVVLDSLVHGVPPRRERVVLFLLLCLAGAEPFVQEVDLGLAPGAFLRFWQVVDGGLEYVAGSSCVPLASSFAFRPLFSDFVVVADGIPRPDVAVLVVQVSVPFRYSRSGPFVRENF